MEDAQLTVFGELELDVLAFEEKGDGDSLAALGEGSFESFVDLSQSRGKASTCKDGIRIGFLSGERRDEGDKADKVSDKFHGVMVSACRHSTTLGAERFARKVYRKLLDQITSGIPPLSRDFSERYAKRCPANPSRPGAMASGPRMRVSRALVRPKSPPPWPA